MGLESAEVGDVESWLDRQLRLGREKGNDRRKAQREKVLHNTRLAGPVIPSERKTPMVIVEV